jgi:hypothetical protein
MGANRAVSLGREDIVEKRTLIYSIAPVIFALAAGCSAMSGEKRDDAGRSGDEVTIAGCLSTDATGRYALTAAPDASVSTVARAMDDERDTKTYLLVGGDNLQAHIGKRVEVTGVVSGDSLDMEHKDTKKTDQQPATGGDDNQPSVKTKEEIDLEARELSVRQIRDVAPTCVVNP